MLTKTFAGGSLIFHLQLSTPSGTGCFMDTGRNGCISFGCFSSGCFRFPQNSLISFHLPLYSSVSLNPIHVSYHFYILFQYDPRSTCIPCKVVSIVSARLSYSSGPCSPSSRSHHEQPSGPPLILPGTSSMSKPNCHVHAISRCLVLQACHWQVSSVDALMC